MNSNFVTREYISSIKPRKGYLHSDLSKQIILNNTNGTLHSVLSTFTLGGDKGLSHHKGCMYLLTYILIVVSSSTSFMKFLSSRKEVLRAPVFIIQFLDCCRAVSSNTNEDGIFSGKVVTSNETLVIIRDLLKDMNDADMEELTKGTVLQHNGFNSHKNITILQNLSNELFYECKDNGKVVVRVNYPNLVSLLNSYSGLSKSLGVVDAQYDTYHTNKLGVFKYSQDWSEERTLEYSIYRKALDSLNEETFQQEMLLLYTLNGRITIEINQGGKEVRLDNCAMLDSIELDLSSQTALHYGHFIVSAVAVARSSSPITSEISSEPKEKFSTGNGNSRNFSTLAKRSFVSPYIVVYKSKFDLSSVTN